MDFWHFFLVTLSPTLSTSILIQMRAQNFSLLASQLVVIFLTWAQSNKDFTA